MTKQQIYTLLYYQTLENTEYQSIEGLVKRYFSRSSTGVRLYEKKHPQGKNKAGQAAVTACPDQIGEILCKENLPMG